MADIDMGKLASTTPLTRASQCGLTIAGKEADDGQTEEQTAVPVIGQPSVSASQMQRGRA